MEAENDEWDLVSVIGLALCFIIVIYAIKAIYFDDAKPSISASSSASADTPDILKPVDSDSKLIRAKALLPKLESCPNGDEATKKAEKDITYYRGAANGAIDTYVNYKSEVANSDVLTKKAWDEIDVVDESWTSGKVGYNIDKIVEHRIEGLNTACKIAMER